MRKIYIALIKEYESHKKHYKTPPKYRKTNDSELILFNNTTIPSKSSGQEPIEQ